MIRFSLIRSHLSLRVLPTTDSTRAGVTPLSALSALLSLVARSFVQTTLGQKTFSRLPSVIASVQQALRQGRQLYVSLLMRRRKTERTRHIRILAFGYNFSLSCLPSRSHMRMPSFQSLIASDLHYTFSERCKTSTSGSHQLDEVCPYQPSPGMRRGGHTVKHRPSADQDPKDIPLIQSIPTTSKSHHSLPPQVPYPHSTYFLAGAQSPPDMAYQAIDLLLIQLLLQV
jgi:hypothetical protein